MALKKVVERFVTIYLFPGFERSQEHALLQSMANVLNLKCQINLMMISLDSSSTYLNPSRCPG